MPHLPPPCVLLCRTWITRPAPPPLPATAALLCSGPDYVVVLAPVRDMEDWADDALYSPPVAFGGCPCLTADGGGERRASCKSETERSW